MIIQGRNLIISADGKVIAGAKSCDINVQCSTIPVSSPANGQWEYSLPDMKSWSVTTNHLMQMTTDVVDTIEAVGTCHNGTSHTTSHVTLDGWTLRENTNRGLRVIGYVYNGTSGWMVNSSYEGTFDTYGSTQALTQMATFINNIPSGVLVAIISFDAYAIDSTLAGVISTKLGIPLDRIAVVTPRRAAFACVGVVGYSGIAQTNLQEGGVAHAKLLLNNDHLPITATPMKDAIGKVGTQVKLQVQVDGLAYDRVSGNAHVSAWRETGTQGNLAQGSFQFIGNGPLE